MSTTIRPIRALTLTVVLALVAAITMIAAVTAAPPEDIPATGDNTGALFFIGLTLLLIGAAMTLVGRRQNDGAH